MALTKPAGTWAYNDLFELPDDGRRYEIIEGELYEMPAPGTDHAMVVINLITLLLPIVAGLGGRLFTAPVNVVFPGADPVQPDLLVLLPGWEGTLSRRCVEGPPDLVIEVLSPSNRTHDRITKRALYARGGVREYWIVDPDNRTVDISTLDRDALRTVQTASGDDVAVSPLLGGLTVPLTTIFAHLDEIED